MKWNAVLPTTVRDWFPRGLFLEDLVEFSLRPARYLPDMDIYNENEDIVIKMEVPDFRSEDVDISMDRGLLTISGKHEHDQKVEEKDYYRRERHTGAFTRTVQLPHEVSEENVAASLKDGVLEVRVTGAAAAEAVESKKKIPIASS